MQDIDVIARNNAKAVQDSIPRFLRQGKYVVETREGLHFVGISTHDTLEQAQAAAAEINNPATGTATTIHPPNYIDPLTKQEQQDATLAQQAVKADPKITEVAAPAARKNLSYGVVQVVALVVTDGKEVWPLPPHQAAAVLHDNDPKQIIALCGPVSDLASVQDAVVLAKAYELRDALGGLLRGLTPSGGSLADAIRTAQRVLDAASPVFAEVTKPTASNEQRLADAMANFDPSLTPSNDTGVDNITPEDWSKQLTQPTPAGSILSGDQLGSFDATPSESQPA
jgi:hypothetical protein